MRINFTFRNVPSSDGVKEYASEKVSKLQKYLRAPLDCEVTLSKERHLHMVDVHLTADGKRFDGHDESEDMYASIDLCLDKLDRQVRNSKSAESARKRHP